MSNWQTASPIVWYKKLYWVLWNSAVAWWDDLVVTWDAVGDHGWYAENAQSWHLKNSPEWKAANSGTWYTRN